MTRGAGRGLGGRHRRAGGWDRSVWRKPWNNMPPCPLRLIPPSHPSGHSLAPNPRNPTSSFASLTVHLTPSKRFSRLYVQSESCKNERIEEEEHLDSPHHAIRLSFISHPQPWHLSDTIKTVLDRGTHIVAAVIAMTPPSTAAMEDLLQTHQRTPTMCRKTRLGITTPNLPSIMQSQAEGQAGLRMRKGLSTRRQKSMRGNRTVIRTTTPGTSTTSKSTMMSTTR